jgi:hypothetical protein
MEEDTTFLQLTYLLSEIMRRIHGKPLDKAGDMRFKYMSPEQRAETADDADRRTATRMENAPWKTQSPSTSLCAL